MDQNLLGLSVLRQFPLLPGNPGVGQSAVPDCPGSRVSPLPGGSSRSAAGFPDDEVSRHWVGIDLEAGERPQVVLTEGSLQTGQLVSERHLVSTAVHKCVGEAGSGAGRMDGVCDSR